VPPVYEYSLQFSRQARRLLRASALQKGIMLRQTISKPSRQHDFRRLDQRGLGKRHQRPQRRQPVVAKQRARPPALSGCSDEIPATPQPAPLHRRETKSSVNAKTICGQGTVALWPSLYSLLHHRRVASYSARNATPRPGHIARLPRDGAALVCFAPARTGKPPLVARPDRKWACGSRITANPRVRRGRKAGAAPPPCPAKATTGLFKPEKLPQPRPTRPRSPPPHQPQLSADSCAGCSPEHAQLLHMFDRSAPHLARGRSAPRPYMQTVRMPVHTGTYTAAPPLSTEMPPQCRYHGNPLASRRFSGAQVTAAADYRFVSRASTRCCTPPWLNHKRHRQQTAPPQATRSRHHLVPPPRRNIRVTPRVHRQASAGPAARGGGEKKNRRGWPASEKLAPPSGHCLLDPVPPAAFVAEQWHSRPRVVAHRRRKGHRQSRPSAASKHRSDSRHSFDDLVPVHRPDRLYATGLGNTVSCCAIFHTARLGRYSASALATKHSTRRNHQPSAGPAPRLAPGVHHRAHEMPRLSTVPSIQSRQVYAATLRQCAQKCRCSNRQDTDIYIFGQLRVVSIALCFLHTPHHQRRRIDTNCCHTMARSHECCLSHKRALWIYVSGHAG